MFHLEQKHKARPIGGIKSPKIREGCSQSQRE